MLNTLPRLAQFKGMVVDLLFPQWCVGCGKQGTFICPDCLRSLPRIEPPLCPRCGRPQFSGILCPACVRWQAKIDGIRAPFQFSGVIRQAICQLKYQNLRALAPTLARLLQDYLVINPLPREILVPVPLHRKRVKERGYNQSGMLAKELGKLIGLPVIDDCLIRQQHTLPQARTSTVNERQSNVAHAFTCRDQRLRGKQILLIDDVYTSGATLDACATALKATGAASAWGLVVASEI